MADEPTNPPNPSDGGDKTFTQADLDRIVSERLTRERSKYADYDELKTKAGKLDEIEQANKTEVEKLREELESTRSESSTSKADLLRLQVALDKAPEGMSLAKVRKLAKRLTGSTREELEADAGDLFEDYGGTTSGKDTGDGDGSGDGSGGDDTSRRPRERLLPGASSETDTEDDPEKLADAVLQAKRGF